MSVDYHGEPNTVEFEQQDAVKDPVIDVQIPSKLLEVNVNPSVELLYDDIYSAIKEDEVPNAILKTVLEGFAEEQSSLKQLREKKYKEGKDTSNVSVKRGQLLKYISDTLMQKQMMMGQSSGDIDLRGPKMKEVFRMLLTIVSDTLDEVNITTEHKEIFFSALQKNIEGWEEKAEKIIKAMTMKIK